MSVAYIPVQWTRAKWIYDAVLVTAVVLYVWAFVTVGNAAAQHAKPVDGAILNARALGTCAFFMLSAILAIGPAARLDRRFLPLLYNRRHFGVITALVALGHAVFVVDWYFAFSPTPKLEGLLLANTDTAALLGFPFEWLGIAALLVLAALAATSHDFWLSFLGAPIWKRLHLSIYAAYALAVGHIALGALQSQQDPTFALLAAGAALGVVGLHLAARGAARAAGAAGAAAGAAAGHAAGAAAGRAAGAAAASDAWLAVPGADAVAEGRALIVAMPDGRRAAVFRQEGTLAALSNACAHQNGPLGEGRILDGCVTCPWHGFQYRLVDGRSPPPFTERVPTYNLRRSAEGTVEIRVRANPPGTATQPIAALPPDAGSGPAGMVQGAPA